MKKFLLLFLALTATTISFAQKIAGGAEHSIFVCSTGSVQAWGANYDGQLGNGSSVGKKLPNSISGLSGITAVSVGIKHTLFLKNNGTVWVTGSNSFGQIGIGNSYYTTAPWQITTMTGTVTAIAAGEYHSLFLKSDGTVWACGWNADGQLGNGANQNRNTPVQVSGLTGITAIAAGGNHSLFLKSDGTEWACGLNAKRQLGSFSFSQINTPVQVPVLTGITAIAAGENHSLFLKNNGTVWGCGDNRNYQLGIMNSILFGYRIRVPMQIDGLTTVTVTAIAAGNAYSLFLTNNGAVWGCGTNNRMGNANFSAYPRQAAALTGSVTSIAAGRDHSLFIKSNGTLWTFGNNSRGQLGDGTNINKSTPVQISACVIVPQTPTVNFSNFPTSLCLGSTVNSEPSITGSNPALYINIDNSINVTAPNAITKNSHAVFVLDGNSQILRYGLNGVLQYTYNPGGATLAGIKIIAVDENDNVYANNGNDVLYTFNTSAGSSTVQSFFLSTTSIAMLYGANTYVPENVIVADNGSIFGVHSTNPNTFTNSQYFGDFSTGSANPITSMTLDKNYYAERRMLAAEPSRNKLWAKKFYDATSSGNGEDIKLLVDSNQTEGMALDFIHADTINNIITASSSTTRALAIITSFAQSDGTQVAYMDTTLLTKAVNAQMPVGMVSASSGNTPQFWIADKTLNKVIRATPFMYSVMPKLPAGLKFNPLTGKIDGMPTAISSPQTYTITVANPLGTNTSFFTFGVTPTGTISNTAGTSTATAVHDDGLTIKYFATNNCTRIIEIADSIGGTSPGSSTITQDVFPTIAVFAADTFLRRVTKIIAQNQDSIKANIKLFYTYQDVQLFKTSLGLSSLILSNDTNATTNPSRTMQVAVLQMHDKPNGSKEVIKHSPVSAKWSSVNKHWAVNFPVKKFSEFYATVPNRINSFSCTNTGKDSIFTNNSSYTWNFTTYTVSGTYQDVLINKSGCDSTVTLKLRLNVVTGLTTPLLEKGLNLYPNPSSGVLYINVSDANVVLNRITVLNIIGKEVYHNENPQSKSTIDLSNLPKGIYFVKINSEYETVTKKIIIE